MRFSLLTAIMTAAMLCPTVISADNISDLPVKTVNGQSYHYYVVKPKETVYSLTRRFGITSEELYRNNPKVRDGLKADDTLLFPAGHLAVQAAESSAPSARQNQSATHLVVKGETIIGIARKYGLKTAQLFEWNPSARDGIRAGQRLIVSDPNNSTEYDTAAVETPSETVYETAPQTVSTVVPSDSPAYREYTVREKETFYSIARANGLTIDQLEAANPDVGVLHTGDIIRIPVNREPLDPETTEYAGVTDRNPDSASGPSDIREENPSDNTPGLFRRNTVDIAVVLPLMHTTDPQPKQAQLHTEFLKGLLIAADSLRNSGATINLAVFDTYGSTDTIQALIDSDRLAGSKVIIAPDSETHLSILADYARRSGSYVFNPFVVRDETWMSNPALMQANIPQQMMYDKAIEGLITRYAHFRPVFISREDSPNDKEAFVAALKKRLDETGIEYLDINFAGSKLGRDELNALPSDKPLLFIPTSGRQAEANRIFPVLVDFKNDGNDVMVFGYPEWTTFRGETLDNMSALNTIVYSRFFMTPDDSEASLLDGRFVYWFGAPMNNVLPRQGLLGFDSGMYLIRTLSDNGGDFSVATPVSEGIQNSFHFVVPDGSLGLVNDALYLINYRPGGAVDSTLL
ncbi:MAG: LysM peptidoglycan-binding domain-containing protein [Clostridium sp.]|nr:LysM peptidoglycan-binding domain-containing protein [Clostridium sp.]